MKHSKRALDWFHRKTPTLGKPICRLDGPAKNSDNFCPKPGLAKPVLDTFTVALEFAHQALDIARIAPFIGPAAALLHKIIDLYKDLKDTEEKYDALTTRIADITGDLCATVLRMQEMNHCDRIRRLQQDLETYAAVITKASQFIEEYEDQGKYSRFAGHNQLAAQMAELDRELNSFSTRFGNNRLVDLYIKQSMNTQTLREVLDTVVAEKLEEWLELPPDMKRKQHDTEKLHMEGTARWLLESDKFIEWEENGGVLWIEGSSGTGKSVLSATVIKKLFAEAGRFTAHPPAIAFFYFDFRTKETQSLEIALRRIVLQLSAQCPHPYKTLNKHYELLKGQRLPSYKDLQYLLYEVLSELRRTYIILDALDECNNSNFNQLVAFVSVLRTWQETPLHLLITSQTRDVFTKSFDGMAQIALDLNVTQKDIEVLVFSELQTSSDLEPRRSKAIQVTERITLNSNGMFRLAACLLIEISHYVYPEDEDLDKALETLPNDLMGIYDRFILTIPRNCFSYAEAALRWIMFHQAGFKFNLDLTKLADAVAFDFSDPLEYTYKPHRQEVNTCLIPKGLAGLIRLFEEQSKRYNALFCLTIDWHSAVLPPLHFCCKEGYFECVSHLLANGVPINVVGKNGSPLSFASSEGHFEIVRVLIKNGAGINLAVGENGSALGAVSYAGETDIVQLLIENGANINLTGGQLGSALGAASYHNDLKIVDLLLNNGADINLASGDYGTPLSAAAFGGSLETVRLLLEKGANITLAGGKYGSALGAASYEGHLEIAHLLLENGADVNLAGGKYGSALGTASLSNYFGGSKLDTVYLLLKHGADINLAGGEYGSALGAASYSGALHAVHLLLETGADINLKGGKFGSALAAACSCLNLNKSRHIVHLLLENGADIKSQGSCALKGATDSGHKDIVALLKEHGAVLDDDAQNLQSEVA
ncbi:ankyrin repeat-containing domain protein [Mycena galopus ATCC 62051]|nr:ankyrin repeat-containing domain protein [Mycena galopus ATCC 62051]